MVPLATIVQYGMKLNRFVHQLPDRPCRAPGQARAAHSKMAPNYWARPWKIGISPLDIQPRIMAPFARSRSND
jgi:hypothetical protein